jgi:hypothetical protein
MKHNYKLHFRLLAISLLTLCTLVALSSLANNKPSKEELLRNCIDSNPTDTGCDSCFYHVYGYYDSVPSYSQGHYMADSENINYRIQ